MISNELLKELHHLNRVDKLRVIRLLADDLATEEASYFTSDRTYEIVTPYGNEAAAQVLYDALAAAENRDNKGEL